MFKVGDKVRCVRIDAWMRFKPYDFSEDKIYTVIGHNPDVSLAEIYLEEIPLLGSWEADRFVLKSNVGPSPNQAPQQLPTEAHAHQLLTDYAKHKEEEAKQAAMQTTCPVTKTYKNTYGLTSSIGPVEEPQLRGQSIDQIIMDKYLPKCECGAHSVNVDKHSTWRPRSKYEN